jgi:hypothetical protein
MKVRTIEPPHEVLAQVAVPYAATTGHMTRVRFDQRKGMTFELFDIEVGLFVIGGLRQFALQVKRDEWPTIAKKLGIEE